jgi:hypothetical protein
MGFFKNLKTKVQRIDRERKVVSVGWTNTELSKLAAIHEYGVTITVTPRMRAFLAARYKIFLAASTTQIVIPARAHREKTIRQNYKKWEDTLTKLLSRELKQANPKLTTILESLGLQILHDYQDVIKQGEFTPLSAATLAIRKQTNIAGSLPLNATGALYEGLSSEVIS